jgi:DNA-binding response OmpR family regulator
MCQILIVEDETRLAAFIDKGLKKNGFRTTIAEDGRQALTVTEQNRFDLILLDLGLPILDGWTVLREIRSRGEGQPIIIVTARKDANERESALANGADDYVTKPFRFSDLLERIRALLKKSGS